MKLDCATCGARYSIDENIIPPQGAKIRCRKCGGVIAVAPRVEPAPVSTPLVPPSPQPAALAAAPPLSASAAAPPLSASAAAPPLPSTTASGFSFFSANASPAASPPAAPALAASPPPSAANASAPLAVAALVPEGLSPEERTRHEKARRLARVLASDIAIYNREKKERGLSDGNLVAVLGYEIKKSWEIYKERVGANFANATPYFRDALNDLLAEGKKIF